MSTRSRVLLVCAVVAFLAGVAGFVVGILDGRWLRALPGLVTGFLVPYLYLASRRQDQRDSQEDRREK